MTKRLLCFTLMIAACVTVAACKRGVDPVNKAGDGLALGGYDCVAYHTNGQAVEGSADFTHQWRGATWRFVSAENRDRFIAAPERYAPQYGGYCAWAVSHGYTANGDPKAWKIVGGKLYLNYNDAVKKKWEEGEREYIEQGDHNWTEFLKRKPEHKG
jgi:YHS domain-containing protein